MSQANATSSAPDDRATSFQAVQGPAEEHYSGTVLLVSAYAVLWAIVLAWVAMVWRKQRLLSARLSDLERVLDEAASSNARR
ncbi:MAG TPA: CcmD family protein [Polyangiaceae bacterium]|nr:CcmD family protein [Polyangiaceae bacterium]